MELKKHILAMKGEGKRLKNYSKRIIDIEFDQVIDSWRKYLRFFNDVTNLKFDPHLRNFGHEFGEAKKRIKHIFLEQRELKVKAMRYK